MPLFQHPLQLFSLDHTEAWDMQYDEHTGGVLFLLEDPGPPSAVSFTPLAVTGPRPDPAEELRRSAERLGMTLHDETLRVVAAGPDPTVLTAEGERPNRAGIGARVTVWLLRHGALSLFATHLGPGVEATAARAEATALVAALRFPEVLPPSPEEFRDRVCEIIRREYAPHAPTKTGEWSLDLEKDGRRLATLNLENVYRDALLEAESAGALIRDYLDRFLSAAVLPEGYDSYEAVRARLLPMLKAADWGEDGPPLARAEFAPGLALYFAIDEPEVVAYVTEELLTGWDVPLERVQGVAIDNLAKRGELEMMALPGADGRPLALVISTHDGFDVSRLALPGVRDACATELGDEYLVGLPNRDFLIAFSERDPETARGIIRQVKHDYQRMNHPITPVIYRVRPDSIEPTDL